MVSKKTKIRKIFQTEEEIIEEMLKEDQQRNWVLKEKIKHILHHLRIHKLKVLKKSPGGKKWVSKCEICGEFFLRGDADFITRLLLCGFVGFGGCILFLFAFPVAALWFILFIYLTLQISGEYGGSTIS